MQKRSRKIIAFLICFMLVFEQSGFAQVASVLDISGAFAGLRNSLVFDKFRPVHLRYLSYDNAANNFKLLLDKGDAKNIDKTNLEDSTKTLLKYFFIGISIPNEKFWVNLRPDGEDNIIDPVLAKTDAGKILLEADLQLKKDTALATSPKTPEGKAYWDKLYRKSAEIFGSDNVSIPTLTRPWIVPGEIIIRETATNAYVYKATLKVMLEQDYLAGSSSYNFKDPRQKALNEYSSELIRETIIPKLTREINTSKQYAPLRQLYYSLILAQWFKSRFYGRGGLYSWVIDRENLSGITSKEPWSKEVYYNEYKNSFTNGEYNIKEPVFTPSGQVIRSYFSGGIELSLKAMPVVPTSANPVTLKGPIKAIWGDEYRVPSGRGISGVSVVNSSPVVNDPFSGLTITAENLVASSPAAPRKSASFLLTESRRFLDSAGINWVINGLSSIQQKQLLNAQEREHFLEQTAANILGVDLQDISLDYVDISLFDPGKLNKTSYLVSARLRNGAAVSFVVKAYKFYRDDRFGKEVTALRILGGGNAPECYGSWVYIPDNAIRNTRIGENGYMLFAEQFVSGMTLNDYVGSIKHTNDYGKKAKQAIVLAIKKYASAQLQAKGSFQLVNINPNNIIISELGNGKLQAKIIDTGGQRPGVNVVRWLEDVDHGLLGPYNYLVSKEEALSIAGTILGRDFIKQAVGSGSVLFSPRASSLTAPVKSIASSSPAEMEVTRRGWLAAVFGGAIAVAVGTKMSRPKENKPAVIPDLAPELKVWSGYPTDQKVALNFRDNSNLPKQLQSDLYGVNRDGRYNLNNLYIAVVSALLAKMDPFFAVAQYIQEGRVDVGMNFNIPGAVINEEFWQTTVQPRYSKVYGKEIPFSAHSWRGVLNDPYVGPFVYRAITEVTTSTYPQALAARGNDFVAANKTADIKYAAKSIQLYQGWGSVASDSGKFINYRKAGPHQYQYGYSVLAIMRMLQQGENKKIMDELIQKAKDNIPASIIERLKQIDGPDELFAIPAGNAPGHSVEALNINLITGTDGPKVVSKQVVPENNTNNWFSLAGDIIRIGGWAGIVAGAGIYAFRLAADARNDRAIQSIREYTTGDFDFERDRILSDKGLSLDILHKAVLAGVVQEQLKEELGRKPIPKEISVRLRQMSRAQIEAIVVEFKRSINDVTDDEAASSPATVSLGQAQGYFNQERRSKIKNVYFVNRLPGLSYPLHSAWPLAQQLEANFPNAQINIYSPLLEGLNFGSGRVKFMSKPSAEASLNYGADSLVITDSPNLIMRNRDSTVLSIGITMTLLVGGRYLFSEDVSGGGGVGDIYLKRSSILRALGFENISDEPPVLTEASFGQETKDKMVELRQHFPELNSGKSVLFANILSGNGASWRIEKERWMGLLKVLLKDFDGYIIVNESFDEDGLYQKEVAQVYTDLSSFDTGHKLIRIGNNDPVRLMAVMALSDVILTVQSGVSHLADWMRKPTIAFRLGGFKAYNIQRDNLVEMKADGINDPELANRMLSAINIFLQKGRSSSPIDSKERVLEKYELAAAAISPETIYRLETTPGVELSVTEEKALWAIFHENNPELSNRNELPAPVNTIIREMLKQGAAKPRILDLGSGTEGAALKRLNAEFNGRLDAWGVDISVGKAALSDGVILVEADIRNLPFFDDSFDIIFEEHTLGYFRTQERFSQVLSEVIRVLKPGGKFIFNHMIFEAGFDSQAMEVIRKLENNIVRMSFEGDDVVLTKKSSSSPTENNLKPPIKVDALVVNNSFGKRPNREEVYGDSATSGQGNVTNDPGRTASSSAIALLESKVVIPEKSPDGWLGKTITITAFTEEGDMGIHQRPTKTIVAKALEFKGTETKIYTTSGKEANLQSMLSMMALWIKPGDDVRIETRGPKAEDALVGLIGVLAPELIVKTAPTSLSMRQVIPAQAASSPIDSQTAQQDAERLKALLSTVQGVPGQAKVVSDFSDREPTAHSHAAAILFDGAGDINEKIVFIWGLHRRVVLNQDADAMGALLGMLEDKILDNQARTLIISALDHICRKYIYVEEISRKTQLLLAQKNLTAEAVDSLQAFYRRVQEIEHSLEAQQKQLKSLLDGKAPAEFCLTTKEIEAYRKFINEDTLRTEERDAVILAQEKIKKYCISLTPVIDFQNALIIMRGLLKEDPTAVSSPAIQRDKNVKGGIDFSALPIVAQPLLSRNITITQHRMIPAVNMDTQKQWQEIQNMLNAGIAPSSQRIKDYAAASCANKDFEGEIDKILGCIADIFRMEEDRMVETDPALTDILVILESKEKVADLALSLASIEVASREPKKIE